jgi:Flp pilus assembly protein TadG
MRSLRRFLARRLVQHAVPAHSRRQRDERGSTALELAILAPGLLLFITIVVYAGRVELAGQAVQQAADEAARSASIQRTQAGADEIAGEEARNTLNQQDLDCKSVVVKVDTQDFNTGPGQDGRIYTTVQCDVKVGDLILPGFPGTKTVTARGISPLDTYRERR